MLHLGSIAAIPCRIRLYGICLWHSSIALPVITIDWKYINDVSDCCCGGGNGNLWAAIFGIASLIMGILVFFAWRQSIKARYGKGYGFRESGHTIRAVIEK